MSDLLDELREAQASAADAADPQCVTFAASLAKAIAEIKRLRALAGAVTPGPSFAEIKRGS